MGFKQFRKKSKPTFSSHRKVAVFVPNCLYEIVKAKSEKLGMPMSRLICYAIDNEICEGGENAFVYPCEEPKNTFVENAYVDEGGRIFRFLKKYGGVLGIDQLMLARREIGVPDKATLMLGIREILSRGTLVEFVSPTWSKFRFPSSYKVLAVIESVDERKQKRVAELETELAKLKGKKNGVHGLSEVSDGEETE